MRDFNIRLVRGPEQPSDEFVIQAEHRPDLVNDEDAEPFVFRRSVVAQVDGADAIVYEYGRATVHNIC